MLFLLFISTPYMPFHSHSIGAIYLPLLLLHSQLSWQDNCLKKRAKAYYWEQAAKEKVALLSTDDSQQVQKARWSSTTNKLWKMLAQSERFSVPSLLKVGRGNERKCGVWRMSRLSIKGVMGINTANLIYLFVSFISCWRPTAGLCGCSTFWELHVTRVTCF